MAWVHGVIAIALLQYFVFAWNVGRARARFKVAAPATTGNVDFERVLRVQENTHELLIMFVPSIWIFATYVDVRWAVTLGIVYLVGRTLYSIGYTRAAEKRSLGFGLSMFPVMFLMLGSLVGIGLALTRGAGAL